MFSFTGSGSLTSNNLNLSGFINNTNIGGTIDLSNNCIKAASYFNVINQKIKYTVYYSAPKTNSSNIKADAEIKIKDPLKARDSIVSITKIAANLQSTTIDEFKKYQQEDKKILNFLSGTNNLSNESQEIDDYITKNYFKLTGVAKQNSTSWSTIFPNEVLIHICSYLDLNDIVQPALAGESSHTVSE
ncbi:MAG: F-box protein [Rickettsia endosymbiont of Pentastiridius leporinus]